MMYDTSESTQIILSSEDQQSHNADDYPRVQVIICSCTAKSHGIHIRSPSSQSTAYTLQELPELRNFLPIFLPFDKARMKFQEQQESIEALLDYRSHFKNLNLRSRVKKYLRDPRKIGTLAQRARVQTRSFWRCLSFQLIFNIMAVIIWLLIRRGLELFGIRIGPQVAAANSERSRIGKDLDVRGLAQRANQASIERRRLMPMVEDYNSDSWEYLGSYTVRKSPDRT